MVSAEDGDDNEVGGEEQVDESVLPPGPRRSTYTPPTRKKQPGDDDATADDALADAMAASLAASTGSINVIYQLDDIAPSVPEGVPVEQLPASPAGTRIRLAEETDEAPAAPASTGPAEPEVFDASALPSPSANAVPADLPPPPGETAPPIFDLSSDTPEPTPVAEPEPVVEPVETPPEPEPPVVEPVESPRAPSIPEFDQPAGSMLHDPGEPAFIEPTFTDSTPIVQVETPPLNQDEDFDDPDFDAQEDRDTPVFDLTPPPEEPFDEAAALAKLAAPSGRQRQLPQRQSLRDEELAQLLENATKDPDSTLVAMEEFERQLKLREDETREFNEWRATMLVVGTPEAIAAVDEASSDFSDVAQTSSIPVQAPPAPPAEPEAAAAPAQPFDAPPPVFDPAPVHLNAPPPTTGAQPPLADAPPPVMNAQPPLADAPPPLVDAQPPLADAPPPSFEVPAPPIDAPPPLVEPPALPDAWDIPPGTAIPGSETEFDEPAPPRPAPLVEPVAYSGGVQYNRISTDSLPIITGSIDIRPQQLDVDGDDAVDPTDQVPVYGGFDDANSSPLTAEPIHSPRIPEDEIVLGEEQELERPRRFGLEVASLEPIPEEQRVGRAARMFWMWFAANSSVVSIAFGALIFSLGMSLRQAIVGIVAGVAASLLPLGLGTLAGKRSSQPTMVVSRAVFGLGGNAIPAILALVSRVFWGAAMLWVLGRGVAAILEGAELTGGLSTDVLTLISMGGGFVIALVIAVLGYGLIAIFQLIVTIVSSILIVGFIVLTANNINVSTALTFADGSWWLAATAAVLVFSFVGLLWANSTGDLARYQRPGSSGAGSMLWASFGTALPSLVLIGYGALLAASNPDIAEGLLSNPLDTLGLLLPLWYPVPLIAATALSLISGVVVTLYSGGFAFKSLGMSFSRVLSVIVVGLLVAGGAYLLTMLGPDLAGLFRDLATTLAVPVAAWVGIFAADTMIRNRRYHSESLLKTGGVYPTINWVNLPALFVITGVGFGLTTATVSWLQWQGYLFSLVGIPIDGELAGADLGVFVALLLGVLIPVITGIPTIRRQEAASASRS